MTDLATRVEETKVAQAAGASGPTIFDLIKQQAPGFARALPSHITAERFVRVVLTEVKRTPKLLNCHPDSLLGALMLCAQLGLEPGPLGHAYLVPFGNQCTFIPGYRGLIDLARRSGHVDSIYAVAVFEGDEFAWTLGLHRDITHKPTGPDRDDPKKISHVYAVAHLKDTPEPVFEVMTRAQVDKIRKRSKASDNGPWVTDYEQMSLKTVTRRLAKWLPLSVETATVVAADEMTPAGMNIDIEDLASATLDAIDTTAVDTPPDGQVEPQSPPGGAAENGDHQQPASPPTPAGEGQPADTPSSAGSEGGPPAADGTVDPTTWTEAQWRERIGKGRLSAVLKRADEISHEIRGLDGPATIADLADRPDIAVQLAEWLASK